MHVIGMDLHRSFAQVAILEDGEIKRQLRVDLIRHRVLEFAETLRPDEEVVVEATGNSAAVERLLRPYVKRVAIANPRLVRAIAYAVNRHGIGTLDRLAIGTPLRVRWGARA
jgi:transposase